MEKIVVDQSLCIGCGACVSLDSEHFDFNDSGLASCINQNNLENSNLSNAIDSCPTGAIKIAKTDEEQFQEDENSNCESACSSCACACS